MLKKLIFTFRSFLLIKGGMKLKYKWMEHLVNAWDAFMEDLFSFVPENSKTHLKNARKEFLLALRSILDKKIEEIEKPKKVKKIEVEKS